MYSVTVLQAEGPKSRCQQGRAPLKALGDMTYLHLLRFGGCQLSSVFLGLQLRHCHLCLHPHMTFFLCVCVCVYVCVSLCVILFSVYLPLFL